MRFYTIYAHTSYPIAEGDAVGAKYTRIHTDFMTRTT